ncbi:hypothetical protein NMY22_g4912 [Coprinellus aureogranulatus]|nr:hypothetical protein NMY22_g4912 [Coprinellus aureogranulatus]
MARSNRTFRRALINVEMDRAVWRPKRQEFEAPDPPPGFSEAKWVAFLFSSFCFGCGNPNVLTDFWILTRACNACKRLNYLSEYDYNPDLDQQILDGVPWTSCGPFSRDPTDHGYCWQPELDKVVTQWYNLQANQEDGTPANVEAFTAYWEGRLYYVQWIQLNAQICHDWAETLRERRLQDRDYINQIRAETVRRHFYGLGYELIDVDAVIYAGSPDIRGTTDTITPRVMRNIEARVEPQIIQTRDTRLYSLKADLINARMDILGPLWQRWTTSLNTSTAEKLTYPPDWYLIQVPAFTELLEAGPEVVVTEQSFYPLVHLFPAILEGYLEGRREGLLNQLPYPPNPHAKLDLATSVFTPPLNSYTDSYDPGKNGLVIGWKMHSMYHGWVPEPEALSLGFEMRLQCVGNYHSDLSMLSDSLVRMCGRDPRTCTAEDMDRLNKRFLCRECVNVALRRGLAQPNVDGNIRATHISVNAYTWRAALSHAWTDHPDAIPQMSFMLLEDATLIRDVRRKEREALQSKKMVLSAWYCNHCLTLNNGQAATEVAVRTHLQEAHGIVNPGNSDIAFDERFRFHVERPCTVQLMYERTESIRAA